MSFPGDISKYKNHLEQFFWYMYNNSDVNAKCPHIVGQLSDIYGKLKSIRDCTNWSLSINPPLNIPIGDDDDFKNKEGCFLVGGKVEVERSKLIFHSFSVSIVEGDRIVRRFHFDVHAGEISDGRPKCHMQYGGDVAYELGLMSHLQHNLEPWLKKPRFPFPPIDVVLLFDLALRQIETALGRKFVEENYWKKLAKKSELIIMKNYYDYVHGYFGSETEETLFQKLSR